MYKSYQRTITAIRVLLALAMVLLWAFTWLVLGCGVIEGLSHAGPGSAGDAAMMGMVAVYFIIPLAGLIPSIVGVIVWAPVDFLLGLISGKPVLLPWLED